MPSVTPHLFTVCLSLRITFLSQLSTYKLLNRQQTARHKGYKYKGCLQDNTAGTQGGRSGPPLPGPLTVLHLPRHLPAPPPAGPQEEHPRLGSSKPLLSPRSGGSRWRRPGRTPGGGERTTEPQLEIARWKTRGRRIGWRSRNPGRRRIRRR